jgi:hypothetical protein
MPQYAASGAPVSMTEQGRRGAELPKGRHTLAENGLDEAAIDRAFGDYLEHYGVVRERE